MADEYAIVGPFLVKRSEEPAVPGRVYPLGEMVRGVVKGTPSSPPVLAEESLGSGETVIQPTGTREYPPPLGDQSSFLSVAYEELVAEGFSIHNGDFTIECLVRVDYRYNAG